MTVLAIAALLSSGDGLWETRADQWAAAYPDACRSEENGSTVRCRHAVSAVEGGQVLGTAELVFENGRLAQVWARFDPGKSGRREPWAQMKEALARSLGAPSRSVGGCLDEWKSARAHALFLADGVAIIAAPAERLTERSYLLATGPGCNTALESSPAHDTSSRSGHCDTIRAVLASKGVKELLANCYRPGERILFSSSSSALPAESDCLVNGIEVVRRAKDGANEAGLRIDVSQVDGRLRFVADYGFLGPPKCPPGSLCGSGSGCGSVVGSLEKKGHEWSVGE
jgi:hypothetical protein